MRRTSTFGGMVYLGVVALSLAGIVVAAAGPWRVGVTLMGATLLAGAAFRSVLPDLDAGMLRVRHNRWVDVLMLVGVGLALVVLANVVPDQPRL